MMGLVVLAMLGGCESDAAKSLRTCAGGNTVACFTDGNAAMAAAQPNFTIARASYSAACRPLTPEKPTSTPRRVPQACHELAKLVRDARGGPKDLLQAEELFGVACRDGYTRSCVDLAALLWTEDEARLDSSVRASVLWEDTCSKVDLAALPESSTQPHDLADACEGLGRAYQTGIGVDPPVPNADKAAALYLKSCDARWARGCVAAGALAAEATGKDALATAAAFYDRACRLDAHFGCFDLAQLHVAGRWEGAKVSDAIAFYRKTCASDPTRGCFEAAELLVENKLAASEGEIASLYNLACDHGNSFACQRRTQGR